MKKNFSLLLAGILAALSSSSAAVIYSTWDDATYNNGTFAWSDASHWDNGIPNTVTNLYIANITHSTGDLVITTSTSLLVGYDPNPGMNNSAFNPVVNSGSLTLKLGANFTTQGLPVFTNSTLDTSKLAFDVNDFTLNAQLNDATSAIYFTVKSSATDGGGTYTAPYQFLSPVHMDVQNNVLVNLTVPSNHNLSNTTWSSTSTLQFSGAGFQALPAGAGSAVGNLIIGSATGSKNTTQLNAGVTMRVASNVTYNTSTTLHADSLLTFGGSTSKLYVGGNFTDNGNASSNTQDYGNGTIYFNGGAGSQKSVSIGRTGLTTKFQVGESSSIFGNVALSQNLVTTGSLTILRGSRLNVGAFTMTAGSMDLSDNAVGTYLTLGDSFGGTNGRFITGGNLALNTFNLDLNYDGAGWTNGSNLVLFTYSGTLTGTPTLGNVTFNTGLWSYGLSATGGIVQLTNLAMIPEPSSTALLIGACGTLTVWTLRRKKVSNS